MAHFLHFPSQLFLTFLVLLSCVLHYHWDSICRPHGAQSRRSQAVPGSSLCPQVQHGTWHQEVSDRAEEGRGVRRKGTGILAVHLQ